jgi:NAD(P)-dependent dehydrogenase (short-subunit alcohol dehydrogenase family)
MNVSELFSLKDRVALITGGSRGLGLQIAEALGEAGARVVLTARKQGELDEAQAHLRARAIESEIFVCDLQDLEAAQALPGKVLERCKRIDILVNNAGATWGAGAEAHPLEAWHKVINLNLNAVFALTQATAQHAMIPAQYGRIISIASIAGLRGTDPAFMATVAYNTSKGGIVNFTRQIAVEWGRYGITANAIAPGVFPTKMARGTIDKSGAFILDRTPLRRFGGDDDLKGVAVLLASDASSYITGQTIAVDGGMTAM